MNSLTTIAELNALIALLRTVAINDFVLPQDHNDLNNVVKALRDLVGTGGGGGISTKEFTIAAGQYASSEFSLGSLPALKLLVGMTIRVSFRTLAYYSEIQSFVCGSDPDHWFMWSCSCNDITGIVKDVFIPYSASTDQAISNPEPTLNVYLTTLSYNGGAGAKIEVISGKVIVYYIP